MSRQTVDAVWAYVLALERRVNALVVGAGRGAKAITELTSDVIAVGPGAVPATLASTGVTPGTYGDASNVPQFTVDAKGRLTYAAEIPIASGYTDEQAQDAVGTILVDSATINFTYADGTPSITAIVNDASIDADKLTTAAKTFELVIVIDGGGAAISTGVKIDVPFEMDCTIVGARLLADQSGSIVLDLWKDTYANYPPTVADTITASAKPTLSSATKANDTTLTGWTTSITAGDTLRVNVDSATTVTRVTLALKLVRA